MKDIKIIMAQPDHAQILYNLIIQASDESDFLALSSEERIKEGFSVEKIKNSLQNNTMKMFICFYKNTPIGNLGIHFTSRERFKHRVSMGMNVLQSHWGLGAGKELLNYALDYFYLNKDLEKIELEVRSDNLRAINLYKKFNFKIEGEVSNYFKIKDTYYSVYIMGLKKESKN